MPLAAVAPRAPSAAALPTVGAIFALLAKHDAQSYCPVALLPFSLHSSPLVTSLLHQNEQSWRYMQVNINMEGWNKTVVFMYFCISCFGLRSDIDMLKSYKVVLTVFPVHLEAGSGGSLTRNVFIPDLSSPGS